MTSDEPALRVANSAAPIELGAVLARAGEGTIYEVVDHPEWVAKVFHPGLTDLSAKLEKVAAMVGSPDRAVQPDGFVVLTWPAQLLVDARGPMGYVMARLNTATAVEIHTLSNPSTRAQPLRGTPQWTARMTWQHLVNVAANLCLAVDAVHRVDAVIGDFQERNILVHDTTQVSLVDCDSMQYTDVTGRSFPCGVGRPEFTAPELAGLDLRVHVRDKTSDLFALAVHIHLLLMAGNHPFLRGQWVGEELPDALTLAQWGDWAGGPDSALRTHPLAPPVTFLPAEIQQLFTRAFTDGAHDPSRRPAVTEWRAALLRIRTIACGRGVHQIPINAAGCPWCGIDDERSNRKHARALNQARGAAATTFRAPVDYPHHLHAPPVDYPEHLAVQAYVRPTRPAPSARRSTDDTVAALTRVAIVLATIAVGLVVCACVIWVAGAS